MILKSRPGDRCPFWGTCPRCPREALRDPFVCLRVCPCVCLFVLGPTVPHVGDFETPNGDPPKVPTVRHFGVFLQSVLTLPHFGAFETPRGDSERPLTMTLARRSCRSLGGRG